MKATYSDEEINELLAMADENWTYDVNIDERAFQYWFKDKYGLPVRMLDMKYARYMLKTLGFGDVTEDYWVMDMKNPFFSTSLHEFLRMDQKGLLPIEATKEQFHKRRLRNLIISLMTSIGVLLYLIVTLIYAT